MYKVRLKIMRFIKKMINNVEKGVYSVDLFNFQVEFFSGFFKCAKFMITFF